MRWFYSLKFSKYFQAKKTELTKALAEAGDGSQKLDIDAVVDPGNPLFRQLFHNYTQDLACEDEIYVLGKNLLFYEIVYAMSRLKIENTRPTNFSFQDRQRFEARSLSKTICDMFEPCLVVNLNIGQQCRNVVGWLVCLFDISSFYRYLIPHTLSLPLYCSI